MYSGNPQRAGAELSMHPGDRIPFPGRFYAWASVIEGGRVVATDYAPDVGWLETNTAAPRGTPAASSPP
jgi:hypothetical protein